MPEPITPITLENAEGRKAAFMPQSDMTALESALLTQLFVKMILNRSGQPLDWEGYVREHGLARHFVMTDAGVISDPTGDVSPGAMQPSFWRGDGIWETPQGGGTGGLEPQRLEYPAQADASAARTKIIVADQDLHGVPKGTRLKVLADMPVPDGWVEEKAA